jgi:hypothetical protein
MLCADGDQLGLPVPNHDHRVLRSASPFRRTARVHDPDTARSRDFRHVAVPVGDDVAAGEELEQTLASADRRAAVVDEPDPKPLELDYRSHRKGRAELTVVHVPLHSDHRAQALQVGEDRGRREIPGVDDGVRGFEDPEAVRRERTRAAREMRVSQERDQNRSGRNSPFR